ncbi:hypothetical protein T07_3145 [Trichinella nelsoni]|uniref:Uncharacterized protein n=1 Tax=Trichinella nelsoni TaxID=6336 RepID=A0A0V0RDV5_9BILA|nr:hypothetical protein T07_6331 [Trichinella nelsoni]KRX12685.1 hypothetical protein T07_3145 [Trichinella nelsoni]
MRRHARDYPTLGLQQFSCYYLRASCVNGGKGSGSTASLGRSVVREGEAWQSLLMWPILPHVHHVLRFFFSRRRRCWGVALSAAAGMSVISNCFNCRATSASSSPTSFRIVKRAAVASVTSSAGCRYSWSASALTEETLALSVVSPLQMHSSFDGVCGECCFKWLQQDLGGCTAQHGKRLQEQPARVTSINPHAFTPLLFTPEKLGGEPLRAGAHTEDFKQG